VYLVVQPLPSNADEEVNILRPQLIHILQAIGEAFQHYGVKSTLLLVDLLGTLVDSVREDFVTACNELVDGIGMSVGVML
jgi:hypothetical protein